MSNLLLSHSSWPPKQVAYVYLTGALPTVQDQQQQLQKQQQQAQLVFTQPTPVSSTPAPSMYWNPTTNTVCVLQNNDPKGSAGSLSPFQQMPQHPNIIVTPDNSCSGNSMANNVPPPVSKKNFFLVRADCSTFSGSPQPAETTHLASMYPPTVTPAHAHDVPHMAPFAGVHGQDLKPHNTAYHPRSYPYSSIASYHQSDNDVSHASGSVPSFVLQSSEHEQLMGWGSMYTQSTLMKAEPSQPPGYSYGRFQSSPNSSATHGSVQSAETQQSHHLPNYGKVTATRPRAKPGGSNPKKTSAPLDEGKSYEDDPVEIDTSKTQLIVNFLPRWLSNEEFRALFRPYGEIIEDASHIVYDLRHARFRPAANGLPTVSPSASLTEERTRMGEGLVEIIPQSKACRLTAAPSGALRSKGYGFIYYRDGASTERAIKEMNGYELHGRKIKVRYADQQRDVHEWVVEGADENFSSLVLTE